MIWLIADRTGASEDDGPATWVSWLKILLGVLLLLVALRQWLIGDGIAGLQSPSKR